MTNIWLIWWPDVCQHQAPSHFLKHDWFHNLSMVWISVEYHNLVLGDGYDTTGFLMSSQPRRSRELVVSQPWPRTRYQFLQSIFSVRWFFRFQNEHMQTATKRMPFYKRLFQIDFCAKTVMFFFSRKLIDFDKFHWNLLVIVQWQTIISTNFGLITDAYVRYFIFETHFCCGMFIGCQIGWWYPWNECMTFSRNDRNGEKYKNYNFIFSCSFQHVQQQQQTEKD